ncbi:MAG TPA: ATP-dependent DNA helicase RecG [Oscillatoriaceae cyanobacterium M33_DOE_052]|uniref:ATP-dependent DNA helicase RecG n=1 Tax=Planktothricoides sp. SpSt-374 TaxID=2282167 RepID=A0A7C3ZPG7_9CYAN|nr:ATP-dependent DNA helicase RecG [Oscillatoriaceae cyanobacterium M33_DOE_052]
MNRGKNVAQVIPDWVRLQKALSLEAKRGYEDMMGKQYRFSEFLQLTFREPPKMLKAGAAQEWQDLASKFESYPKLPVKERKILLDKALGFFRRMEQLSPETEVENPVLDNSGVDEVQQPSSKVSQPLKGGINKQQESRILKIINSSSSQSGEKTLIVEHNKGIGKSDGKSETSGKKSILPIGESIHVLNAKNELPVSPLKEKKYTPNTPTTTSQIYPDDALTQVSGIGAKSGEQLAKLGLYTVRDLLFYYPRDYIDYKRQVKIRDLEAGETVTIVGTVKRCNCFTSPKNKKLTILELVLKDTTGQIRLSRFYAGRFNSTRSWQEIQRRQYPVGSLVAASGLVKSNKYGTTLDNPQLEVIDFQGLGMESTVAGKVVPVYSLTEGVSADLVRKAAMAVQSAALELQDPLPVGLRNKYGLMDLPGAIANIHFPEDPKTLEAARHRLVFDEFFYLQLGLLHRRFLAKQCQTGAPKAQSDPTKGKLIKKFYDVLPFRLTQAQQRVIGEILDDLQKPEAMNRLVQGDVGSGKTVVAVVAMLAAIQAGYQAALMAPTEVLAEQHYKKLVGWLNLLHLPVELLTGSTKAAKRRQIYAKLLTGELPVLVGTHALIQDGVNFQRLGLIVIDEQHRFGVQQRARLQEKGVLGAPHVLTMTATPIPRTLALTLHGDLDVSQIDELPPGRQAIETTVVSGKDREHALDLISREVAQGRQAYVVLPLIEESEKLDLKSALEEYQRLSQVVFPQYKVGLLHGRLASAEKEAAIVNFREGRTQILVSTTVVEVGVDVPNATVMLIENAERFGLSQLHQLRGRVGRGAARSYCLLMTHPNATGDSKERLQVMAQSQDGFFIAEMDMRLRGPGEVLGTRQSGLPDFALANLAEDRDILILARDAAEKVIAKDPTLGVWPMLKVELDERYQRLMGGAIMT